MSMENRQEDAWTGRLFKFSFAILLGSALFLASCSQKVHRLDEPGDEPGFEPAPGKTYDAPKAAESTPTIDLENTYFDYDQAILKPRAKALLRKNAQWLKKHPEAAVQIEGQCDERGTLQYNLALGEKRAAAAKRFLIALGIDGQRVTIVSRGAVPGSDPSRMAKNRKAAFIVYYRE